MNVQLAYEKRVLREGETPQFLFEQVRAPYSFLLTDERFSYIGFHPFALLWRESGTVHAEFFKDFGGLKRTSHGQILGDEKEWAVTDILGKFQMSGKNFSEQVFGKNIPGFCGGAAGFLTYDYGAELMEVRQHVHDDIELPDWMFGLYDTILVVDHEAQELLFFAVDVSSVGAQRKLKKLVEETERKLVSGRPFVRKSTLSAPVSNLGKKSYGEKIAKIHKLLADGETYQVNFSQRFLADSTLDAWEVYKRLTAENPVPFGCYFEYPGFQIASASPELLLRKRGKYFETRPIKGTVARGKTEAEDVALEAELLASEKDAAELTMIVDLARNDVGKVCEAGSVKVESHREVQKYAHLMHTVSRVSGQLLRDATIFECVKALFPGGSITGCPKKRTMEILDTLEDFKRGVYTGSAGFIGFDGNVDLNILIRTALQKDGKIYYHAGGGIVADSDAEAEYEESLLKAKGFFEAVEGG